jgi:hypothetical protein
MHLVEVKYDLFLTTHKALDRLALLHLTTHDRNMLLYGSLEEFRIVTSLSINSLLLPTNCFLILDEKI